MRNSTKCVSLILCGVFLAGLVGCGQNKLGRLGISGKVTLDGKPLPQGLIQFEPVGRGPGAVGSGTSIENGQYSIPTQKGLPPGEYRVRIHSSVALHQGQEGAMPDAGPHAIGREIIPPAYNSDTTLTASISDSGETTFDFALKSR